MIAIYILIAVFIAWIWVDYYRLIDIYEQEKLKYFILTFALGGASVLIVLGINRYLIDRFQFEINGEFANDFLYCVFKIGLIEEFAKSIPFVLIYFIFRKQFTEPVDYLAFISISALGFSAAENALYFNRHGPYIINGRAILSTVGHMFNTALIAYGIICYKFQQNNHGKMQMGMFFFLGVLSHGFYDFWLIHEGTSSAGWLITVLYFLLTISVFAVILNNAINNSSFFSYKMIIDSNKVMGRLFTYYGIVYLSQFLLLLYLRDFNYAIVNLAVSIYFPGYIVIISCIRLSRFKLIKNKWENLKLEFPFKIVVDENTNRGLLGLTIVIKGDPFYEVYINQFYEEYFTLNPLTYSNTYLENPRLSYIEKKIFLKNDQTYYVCKVYNDSLSESYELYLLKPKTSGNILVSDKYPIVAVLKIDDMEDYENPKRSFDSFEFLEWAYVKPYTFESDLQLDMGR